MTDLAVTGLGAAIGGALSGLFIALKVKDQTGWPEIRELTRQRVTEAAYVLVAGSLALGAGAILGFLWLAIPGLAVMVGGFLGIPAAGIAARRETADARRLDRRTNRVELPGRVTLAAGVALVLCSLLAAIAAALDMPGLALPAGFVAGVGLVALGVYLRQQVATRRSLHDR